MWCHSKKEMLEYLGKDWKDVRYINRAIMSGKILERRCMYILASEYIEWLEKEIKNLKEEQGKNTLTEGSISELEEAKIQWEYYQGLYENEVKEKQNKIRKCFQWIKQIKPNADWEEFRDWVMED